VGKEIVSNNQQLTKYVLSNQFWVVLGKNNNQRGKEKKMTW
jgi:hypothetical protein